jgi:hypothetical protein
VSTEKTPKQASIAVAYATTYPGMCKIARRHGYALALHGSMTRDFDLIAIPWTEEASEPEPMIEEIMGLLGACLYPDLLRRQGLTEEQISQIVSRTKGCPESKPHGRKAWALHLGNGCYIDLSVMRKTGAA